MEFAHASTAFERVLIMGNSGSGKTWLARRIGEQLRHHRQLQSTFVATVLAFSSILCHLPFQQINDHIDTKLSPDKAGTDCFE